MSAMQYEDATITPDVTDVEVIPDASEYVIPDTPEPAVEAEVATATTAATTAVEPTPQKDKDGDGDSDVIVLDHETVVADVSSPSPAAGMSVDKPPTSGSSADDETEGEDEDEESGCECTSDCDCDGDCGGDCHCTECNCDPGCGCSGDCGGVCECMNTEDVSVEHPDADKDGDMDDDKGKSAVPSGSDVYDDEIHDEDYDDFETEDEAGSEEDDDDVVDDMEDDPIKDATQATAEEILAVKKATFASIHDTAETGSVTGMVQAIPHLEISDSLHAHFCGTPITNLICEFAHESFSNSGGLFKLQVGKFVCPSEQITKSKGDVYDVLDLIGSYLPEDETAEVHIHDSLKASEFYTFMALQNTRSIQTFRQAVARCKPVPGARPDTESGAARAAMSSTSLYMRYSSSDSNHMLDHAELAVVDEKVRQKNATSLVIGQKLYKGLVKNLWSGEYTRESEISFSDHVSDLQTTIEFTRIDKKLLYRTELETFVDVPLYSQNACPFHVTGAPHACGLCDLDRQLGVACSKWSPSNPTSVRTTRSEFKALVEPYLAKRDILDEKVAADRQASLDAFHALEEKERIKKQKAKDAIKADKAAAKVAKAEAKAQLEKEKVPLVLQDLLELANASGNSLYCEKHGTCGTKQANRQMQCRRCDEKTVWLCIHPARKGHSCPECSKRHMKMFKLKVAAEEPAAVAEKKKAARDAAKAARDALKASSPASASASLPSAYASASGSGTNAASPSKPVKPKAKVPAKAKPAKVAAKVPAKVPTKVPAKVPVEAVAGRKVGEKGKAASDLSAPAAKKLKFEDLRREVAGLKDLAHRLLKDAERVEQLLGAADADSDA